MLAVAVFSDIASAGDVQSTHTDLSDVTLLAQLSLTVDHVDDRVPDWTPDRQCIVHALPLHVLDAGEDVEGDVCHRLSAAVEVAQRLVERKRGEETSRVRRRQRFTVADPQFQLTQWKPRRLGRGREERQDAVKQRSDQRQARDPVTLKKVQKLVDVGRDCGRRDDEVDWM